jgi:hypothetical protein
MGGEWEARTEVVGGVEPFDFGGAFDAGGSGAGMQVSWRVCERGEGFAHIRPRLILPAMVYFSRWGICRGQTIIQGKMAKKKSTRIVETGDWSKSALATTSGLGDNALQRMYDVGRVSMGQ